MLGVSQPVWSYCKHSSKTQKPSRYQSMISHQFVNILVTVTLVELMVAVGLAVTLDDLWRAVRDWRRLARALAANYLVVPAVALLLVDFFIDSGGLAMGILILAVFPGASYGPPFTAFARGDLSF